MQRASKFTACQSTWCKQVKAELLVTSVGEDRPGIVARLTEVFVKHGANLEESRMAILGGEFAAIMLTTLPEEKVPELQNALGKLKDEGITVTTKLTRRLEAPKGFTQYTLILSGADHEGIVHNVAARLRDKMVNIESLETEVINAPLSGIPLFTMKATLQAPAGLRVEDLRSSLAEIANAESVDIELQSAAAGVR
jgi:glycine cleavage system transcriptional repressor